MTPAESDAGPGHFRRIDGANLTDYEEWWRDITSGAYNAWIDKNYGFRIAAWEAILPSNASSSLQ